MTRAESRRAQRGARNFDRINRMHRMGKMIILIGGTMSRRRSERWNWMRWKRRVRHHPGPLLRGEGEFSAAILKCRRLGLPDVRPENGAEVTWPNDSRRVAESAERSQKF